MARGPDEAALRWRVHGVSPSGGGRRFDAVLVEPSEPRPGLILLLHGGPHSVSTTAYDPRVAFLTRETHCAVLLVNYRGSLGFGSQDSNPRQRGEHQNMASHRRIRGCCVLSLRYKMALPHQRS